MKITTHSHRRFAGLAFLFVLASALVLPATSGSATSPLFSDGFETGTLGLWTTTSTPPTSFQPQQAVVFQGAWAGEANVISQPGYASYTFSGAGTNPPPQPDVYLYARVNLRSAPASATLFRLRPATGNGGLVTIGVNANSKLNRKDDVTGVTITSSTILTKGAWHELQVHAIVNGTSSTIEVWLDGTKVTTLSGTDNLGTTWVGRIQVGNDKSSTMDAVFDDVTADTALVFGGDTAAPTVPQNLRTTLIGSNRVDLAWDPSSDAFGVTGYTVYRDGLPLPTTTGTTYSDTGVAPLTLYSYTVDAFDAAGHHSALSSPLPVTTTASDTEKPTMPTGLFASSPYSTRVDLVWNVSMDNTGVVGYTIYRNGSPFATVGGTTLQYQDLTVSPGTPYTYEVDAFDAATPANHSDPSDPSSVTTSNSDPVIGAAGDIACDPADVDFLGGEGTHNDCAAKATSDLMLSETSPPLTAVLPLGDEQYECGGGTAFTQSYDLSWGRMKGISHPVPGNHEYENIADAPTGTGCSSLRDAAGYYQYFGTSFGSGDPAHGYYSFDIGTWHIIALNSECTKIGGCGLGSPEETWLKSDLASHPNSSYQCTLAFWHRPRFASNVTGNSATFVQFWRDLYDADADVVLVAHFHAYERFAPQTPAGALDNSRGIREFIVGTGGENWGTFGAIQPNSLARKTGSFGFLEMTLHPSSYNWEFKPALGDMSFTDPGSTNCH